MASTYGYGKKTFVQGIARLSCRMAKYIVRYNSTLQRYLPPAGYACLGSIASCLNTLCGYLNKSAR